MPHTPQTAHTSEDSPRVASFTRVERASLRQLRARYQAAGDRLSASEVARLQFVRWLYRDGRLSG